MNFTLLSSDAAGMEIIMKKFEGILICTDLDGTLLRDDGTIASSRIIARA